MGFRFFRRIKILPGAYINLGKRGASFSVGPRGVKLNVGSSGIKTSVGMPGTGIRYEKRLTSTERGSAVDTMPRVGGTTKMTSVSIGRGKNWHSTPAKTDSFPPEIADFIRAIKRAKLYSLVMSFAAGLVAFTVAIRYIRLLISDLTIDSIVVFGMAAFVAILIMRAMTRHKLMIPIGKYVPRDNDYVAQTMALAFKSSSVWYDTKKQVGSNRASKSPLLPFPMCQTHGIFAYNLGGGCLVPLRGFVVMVKGLTVNATPNDMISLSVLKSSKMERGHSPNPTDSPIIGRQWLHSTKAGLPDRRYNYNPCMTTYQVGVLGVEALHKFSYWITFSCSSVMDRMSRIVMQNGNGVEE